MTVFCSLTVVTAVTALAVLSSLIIKVRSLVESIFRVSFLVGSGMIYMCLRHECLEPLPNQGWSMCSNLVVYDYKSVVYIH